MENPTWLEISLIVDGEMAESVAEVLARFVPDGVGIESTAVTANDDDEGGRSIGPLRVCGYLSVDEHTEETRQRIEESLWYLGRIRPLPPLEFKTIQQTDWSQAWKQHYKPITIGQNLIIVPAWLESPEPGRTPIRIDPGMAFGTGTHPTTQLCLEVIEAVMLHEHPAEVIDVGCGSGILSIAALKLGARHALGVDIDLNSVRASFKNAEMNGVAGELALGQGSVAETLAGEYSLSQAPLVLANILAPIIIRLFDDGLADLVSPGGSLVLSGILDKQAPDVIAAAEGRGLKLVEQRQVLDWVAIWMRKVS